ncbi:sialic acid-binding Ig-like lectin 10 [Mauremys reevesii]|uniref:sialic acid-binding Ig-like lectin 10 n=1 Tax=Mauremys reevesii TaxID=260615 RepID=UPI00193F6064|nr:sialic acid-binding Ig-like lectin 10 [Mauremys reevesii]
MGRALPPQQDTGERELLPQGPPWRAGGPATLRVLILTLLWRGSLSQRPGFTLTVPQSVSVQEGLCVLVPCIFTYPASSDTYNSWPRLYRYWYKDAADVGHDSPVASTDFSRRVSKETQGRFQLTVAPGHGDCSLQISDAQWTDAGKYFFRFEKGTLKYKYLSNSDGTDAKLAISVPGLMEEPEIQISPARGLPGTLLAGEPVTVTCTAPGRCSGPPPRVTWTEPFSDTAQNVSAQLENGTWAHRSALSFMPGLGDHGKELICSVTYRPPRGPSTNRTIRLLVGYPPGPPNITGTLTRNRHPVPDAWGAEGDVVSLQTQEGDSLSLSCEAGSRAEATLSWAKGKESLSPGQGGARHLELPNLSPGDSGEYRCWAKNSYGSASRALRVHVQNPPRPPNITGTLTRNGRPGPAPLGAEGDVVSLETQEGDSLSLSCEAGSRPEATLSWLRMNRSLSPSQGGAGRLELPNLSPGDAGEYRCWAKNSYGSASRALRVHVQTLEKTLQITVSRANRSDPQLFQDPSTLVANGSQLTAREGDSLRFLCSVASSPRAAVGWVKGGRAVEGTRPMGENQLQLELPNVMAEDGGLYRCWAQREESSAQGTFQLQVEYSPRPGTRLNSSCQRQGASVSCSCSMHSQPPPQLQWQVDGVSLAGNGSWEALQVSSWAQGDEAVSTLSWMGSEDRAPEIFCLGSNRHGSYAALHFELSPPQRGAEEPGKLLGMGVACGLGVAVGFFLLRLCVIKLWGQDLAPPSAEAGEMANRSQDEHTADDTSLIYMNVTTIPMDHKTPAARQTKGVQDGTAAAQAPLGLGKPDELHYASVKFSKLQCKGGEPPEDPAMEYSEVRLI